MQAGHFRDMTQKTCEAELETTFPGRRRGDSNPPYPLITDGLRKVCFGKSNANRRFRPLPPAAAILHFPTFTTLPGTFPGHSRDITLPAEGTGSVATRPNLQLLRSHAETICRNSDLLLGYMSCVFAGTYLLEDYQEVSRTLTASPLKKFGQAARKDVHGHAVETSLGLASPTGARAGGVGNSRRYARSGYSSPALSSPSINPQPKESNGPESYGSDLRLFGRGSCSIERLLRFHYARMAVYEQPLLRGFDDVPRIEKTESNSLAPHWRPLRAEPPRLLKRGFGSEASPFRSGTTALFFAFFGTANFLNFYNSMTVGE